MPFQPQAPFPKSRGDTIRSGDWNDLIGEVQRLDTAKVERAGDAISGSLTVAGTLGVGLRDPAPIPLAVNTGAPDDAPVLSLGTLNNEDFLSVFGGRRGSQLPFVAWKRGDLRLGTASSVTGQGFVERLRITSAGNVGIGADSPYATLTVSGSIGFTNGTTPMLYINQTGTTNPERPIIAHSPPFPTWGLAYRDADDTMIFQAGGTAVMTVGLGARNVAIPTGQLSFGAQTRQMINLWNTQYGIGVQSGTQYYRTDGNFAWFRGGSHNDTATNPGGGVRLMALNAAGDLILSARTNPSANPSGSGCRALVDLGNVLAINFSGDYTNGVQIQSSLVVTTGNAFKPGGGSWGATSDVRLKQHVRPLAGALDKLLRLRGVCFEWKEPARQGNLTGVQIGMLAHEVEEVFPDWISTDAEGYKQLTVRGFEALVVEALRTLKAENDTLKGQNQALEARVMALEAKLQAPLLASDVHHNGAT